MIALEDFFWEAIPLNPPSRIRAPQCKTLEWLVPISRGGFSSNDNKCDAISFAKKIGRPVYVRVGDVLHLDWEKDDEASPFAMSRPVGSSWERDWP